MRSSFTHTIYEIAIVLLLVGHLFLNTSLFLYAADMIAAIPAAIQLMVFLCLFLRHPRLATFLKLWAIYLFIAGGVATTSRIILGISRDSFPEGIAWKLSIILTGIFIFWIAQSKVELIKETPDQKSEDL